MYFHELKDVDKILKYEFLPKTPCISRIIFSNGPRHEPKINLIQIFRPKKPLWHTKELSTLYLQYKLRIINLFQNKINLLKSKNPINIDNYNLNRKDKGLEDY